MVKPNCDIRCDEVNTKFPGYKSFKVGIGLEGMDTIMKPEVWPEGVLVSEFRHHKSGVGGKKINIIF